MTSDQSSIESRSATRATWSPTPKLGSVRSNCRSRTLRAATLMVSGVVVFGAATATAGRAAWAVSVAPGATRIPKEVTTEPRAQTDWLGNDHPLYPKSDPNAGRR